MTKSSLKLRLINKEGIVFNKKVSKVATVTEGEPGGACGVMVTIVGNGHGNMSSNLGRD